MPLDIGVLWTRLAANNNTVDDAALYALSDRPVTFAGGRSR